MNTLFLDLASHSARPQEGACVACVSEKKTESIRFIDHRISDDGIIPVINEALKDAGWTEKDIGQIACVVGPGGFTSLRMAVTLANVYGEQLNVPVAGIHLSDLYAFRVHELRVTRDDPNAPRANAPTRNFFWLHATKKIELFVRGFGEYQKLWPKTVLISLDELVEKYPEGASFAGEVLPEQREKLAGKSPVEAELASVSDALPAFIATQTFDHQTLQPWYGRGW